MKPIDSNTFDHARDVMAYARTQHRDPVEALHRAGLLFTPSLERQVRLEALTFVLDQLRGLKPHELMRRDGIGRLESKTPMDLHMAIVRWLEELVDLGRKGIR